MLLKFLERCELMNETKITLRTELEARIWSDVYMNTIARRCDEFTQDLPFGVKRDLRDKVAIEAVKCADEAVKIYRSGI